MAMIATILMTRIRAGRKEVSVWIARRTVRWAMASRPCLRYDPASHFVLHIVSPYAFLTATSSIIYATQPLTVANPDRVKLKFYSKVLGDNSTFIHYGKWDGLDTEQPGAYGRASEAMTDYMFKISMGLLPHRAESSDLSYVDLGSGTGG